MKKYIVFIFPALILLSSCKKDHSILLTEQEFPTTVGSWWKYQRLNRDNSIFDTTTYTILDIQTVNGTAYQRWVGTQTGLNAPYPDTSYVLVTDAGITLPPDLNIKFPIIDNSVWCSAQQGFSYTTSIQNINVNNVAYNGAIYLNKYNNLGMGTSINESYWIVKNIGFVEQFINDDRGDYFHINLISYHIN